MITNNKILLEIKNLVKHYPIYGGLFQRQVGSIHAVNGVSFDIRQGETFGLVGESGCGKSTVGRSILLLESITSGEVYFDGNDLSSFNSQELRKIRRRMQMIFQDPYSSLNPRMKVREIIAEPLIAHNIFSWKQVKEIDEIVSELLITVQLSPDYATRYPHEFSGGQRQRIGIARAISLKPDLIVCDEPISALDVSIQAQIVNLLEDLQQKMGLTYLFIAHDLAMVRHISKRVAVMYLGRLAEMGNCDDLFENPLHPYTQALLSAVPKLTDRPKDRTKRVVLKGDVPSPENPPSGCFFRTRCPLAKELCAQETPIWREILPEHWAACHIID